MSERKRIRPEAKCYYRCPIHGPLEIDDIKLTIMACAKCLERVEEIPEAWEIETMSEKAKGFIWAASVTLFGLALWLLYKNFENAPILPAFTFSALRWWTW